MKMVIDNLNEGTATIIIGLLEEAEEDGVIETYQVRLVHEDE